MINQIRSIRSKLGLAVAAGAALVMPAANAAFVAYDSGTGAVTFTPGDALTPVITAVVAAILAGVSLFTLVVGTRWVYRMLKASK